MRNFYTSSISEIRKQPQTKDELESFQAILIFRELQGISNSISEDVEEVVSQVIAGRNPDFEDVFNNLKLAVLKQLEKLLRDLSVEELIEAAIKNPRPYSNFPFLGVLVEAFYYIASGLETVFREEAIKNVCYFFEILSKKIEISDQYLKLNELIGHDADIIQAVLENKDKVIEGVRDDINIICGSYVRESLMFYDVFLAAEAKRIFSNLFFDFVDEVFASASLADAFLKLFLEQNIPEPEAARQLLSEVKKIVLDEVNGQRDPFLKQNMPLYEQETFSIDLIRKSLDQHSQQHSHEGLADTEPGIRQLLKLDFEPKVTQTVERTYRQKINQRLKDHVALELAQRLKKMITEQYEYAHEHLQGVARIRADELLTTKRQRESEIYDKVRDFNQAIDGINQCLRNQQLDRYFLSPISLQNLDVSTVADD